MALGWVIQQYGFRQAYGLGAVLAALAIPYFLLTRPVFLRGRSEA